MTYNEALAAHGVAYRAYDRALKVYFLGRRDDEAKAKAKRTIDAARVRVNAARAILDVAWDKTRLSGGL